MGAVTVNILVSKTPESRALLFRIISGLYLNNIVVGYLRFVDQQNSNTFIYSFKAADLEAIAANGQVMIPVEDIYGSIDFEDGYYEVNFYDNAGENVYSSNVQSFAIINELRTKFYNKITSLVYDNTTNSQKVNNAMKVNMLLNTLEFLGENPGNNTDFWNKYEYIDSLVS